MDQIKEILHWNNIITVSAPTLELAYAKMMPYSLMVSMTMPSFPSILSFFLGSYAMAKTSASMDLSAMRRPMVLQALSSMRDGSVFLRSLALVVATAMTLLVPRCMTLAWTNRLEKKTLSRNGRMYMSVRCFHDLRFGLLSNSQRDRRVHAARTTNDRRLAAGGGERARRGDKGMRCWVMEADHDRDGGRRKEGGEWRVGRAAVVG